MTETINQRIRRYRKKARLTQAQLGEMIGLKTSAYSQMERKGHITCEVLLRLADVLKIDATTLLLGESNEPKEEPKSITKPPEIEYWHTVELTTREFNIIKIFRNLSKNKKCIFCENTLSLMTKGKS